MISPFLFAFIYSQNAGHQPPSRPPWNHAQAIGSRLDAIVTPSVAFVLNSL
jgi:hypothetical protein